jgi:RHS repeat-associated protein
MKLKMSVLPCLLLLVFAAVIAVPGSLAQSVPCAAITRNPQALDALLDAYSRATDSDSSTILTINELEHLHFNPIVIQPGDALYVEYRGEPFDLTGHLANGDLIFFDSASKARPDQWRKGIYPLDMFGVDLNQRLVQLTATAKNPAQTSLRNIRLIRAGKSVFEFAQLATYGQAQVKIAASQKLPCRGNDEYPTLAIAYAEANHFATTIQFPASPLKPAERENSPKLLEHPTPPAKNLVAVNPVQSPLTLTVDEINSMALRNAPVIQGGDAILMHLNHVDTSFEIILTNGKKIMNLHAPEGAQAKNGWIGARIKLDRPGMVGERVMGIKITRQGVSETPLLFRDIKFEREGRVILALAKGPAPAQDASNFEPPMSYPPDPRLPNPHVANVSLPGPGALMPHSDSGFLAPKVSTLPAVPMMFQSTTTPTGDPNHYKFQGKELDDETGLYNFGARFYNPALSRFMSPDWSRSPAPVPYANFANPQSLNLYTFGLNNPLSMRDSDGHCPGDDCSKVKVEVKVLDPAKIVKNEKQPGTAVDYATGVRANVQYTITDNGKPLGNTAVAEKNEATRTLNGEQRPGKLDEQNDKTNSSGQINDTFGLLAHSDTPLSAQDNASFVDVLTNNSVTVTGTQTLTFQDQAGTTCSCTVDRTLTNQNTNGTNNGSNYNFTTGNPSAVKPVDKPKEKPQQ